MAEHFVQPPALGRGSSSLYFFLAGLAGGSYALATMLRLWGGPQDEPTARIGYSDRRFRSSSCARSFSRSISAQPLRFWHMLINTTPGQAG